MSFPKISIVTANYNQADYLEQAIRSVVEQRYPNLEYIIIDGGSTDHSVEVIKKYEADITYWVSEKDRGVCDAANKGFRVSTGEVMACINSDDMLHPKSLFTIAEIFSKYPDISWLLGASTIFDELGRTVYARQSKNFSKYHYLLEEFEWIQLESTFWRRSLWDAAGGQLNEDYKFACDFELWMRFFHLSKLYITDALVGGFRMRSSGQLSSANFDKYMNEVRQVLAQQVWDEPTLSSLKRLKKLRKIRTFLNKSRIFNLEGLQRRVTREYDLLMDTPPKIGFNSTSQSFTESKITS